MVLEIIMYVIGQVISVFGVLFPNSGQVPLLLPWGLDDIIISGVSGFKVLATAFPPFTVVLQAFVIYISFKIGMQLLKGVPILGRTIR